MHKYQFVGIKGLSTAFKASANVWWHHCVHLCYRYSLISEWYVHVLKASHKLLGIM